MSKPFVQGSRSVSRTPRVIDFIHMLVRRRYFKTGILSSVYSFESGALLTASKNPRAVKILMLCRNTISARSVNEIAPVLNTSSGPTQA